MAQTDKVRVYGKAQNRTALGIIHAWALAYPNGTLEDLRAAFPNSLNPDKGTKENFILSHEKGTEANWDGYFKEPEEIVLLQDGSQVSVVKMGTKPSFERIVAKAKEYGIVVAEFTEGLRQEGGLSLGIPQRLDSPCRKEEMHVLLDMAAPSPDSHRSCGILLLLLWEVNHSDNTHLITHR